MGEAKTQCHETYKHFIEVALAKPNPSGEDLNITDKALNKLLKECVNDAAAKASEVSVFPKYCDKKTKKMTFDVFFGDYMLELAAVLIQNKKKATKRPELTEPEVVSLADEMRGQIAAKHTLKTKAQKVDSTTARLTDTSKYTGSHKERFDDSGKGKGMSGRVEEANTSGYVQGYKNEGTKK